MVILNYNLSHTIKNTKINILSGKITGDYNGCAYQTFYKNGKAHRIFGPANIEVYKDRIVKEYRYYGPIIGTDVKTNYSYSKYKKYLNKSWLL